MGAQPSSSSASATPEAVTTYSTIDAEIYYAIRLDAEQSLRLYGLWMPKRTLTWRDIVTRNSITMGRCVACAIQPAKLFKLQPDIKEWIKFDKATVDDCIHMAPWRPHPFTDLGCKSIGDLILYRSSISPRLLIDGNVTFRELVQRYGLTPDLMVMLKYSLDEWVQLGMDADFLHQIADAQWKRLFGMVSREMVASLIARSTATL